MARTFRNPANGHVEEVSGEAAGLVILLGPIYLAFKGLWGHFFLWLLVVGGFSLATGGYGIVFALPIATIAYAATINKMIVNSYLRRGWQEVHVEADQTTGQAVVTVSGQRECPYCAELIKAQAKKCKHCGSEVEPLAQVDSNTVSKDQWFVTLPFASNKECREITDKVRNSGYEVPSETSKYIRVGPYTTEALASNALHSLAGDLGLQGGALESASAL
ncbi:zinc ribbon domain-containing protein [Pseudomonas putida]|uniref:zinc ribbon domain-containing protein n=1 Tax=Pseudomonas putida TaxID=303 RepID=UPI0009033867|nr:zinc ribbon domain-containing protein [Pseudomonas putida]